MILPLSRECAAVFDQAHVVATACQQPLDSTHLLRALYQVPNPAGRFLTDRQLTLVDVQRAVVPGAEEAAGSIEEIDARSRRMAASTHAASVTSIHLLHALLTTRPEGLACQAIRRAGGDLTDLRLRLMHFAIGIEKLPARYLEASDAGGGAPPALPWTPSATIVHGTIRNILPKHGVGTRRDFARRRPQAGGQSGELEEHLSGLGERSSSVSSWAADEDTESGDGAQTSPRVWRPKRLRERSEPEERERGEEWFAAQARDPRVTRRAQPARGRCAEPPRGEEHEVEDTESGHEGEQERRREEAAHDARRTTRSLAARLFGKKRAEAEERWEAVAEATAGGEERDGEAKEALEEESGLEALYRLDEELYPNLVKFGRNLTVMAARGKIDGVIGRHREINQLIDIVGKRRSNNPMLVGPPGVGKTAIAEGLALKLVELSRDGIKLGQRVVIELELGRLLSGTHLRGSFSERLGAIKDEVRRAQGQVIVFLDEIHTWIGAGQGGDGGDAANELKTALARGAFPCIGATTQEEFRKFVEADPAFERRFQIVHVEEPDLASAARITGGVSTTYARHHGVDYAEGAIEAAVHLSHRYIPKRRLPDKAITVLDLAGSRAAREGRRAVDRLHVAEIVAEIAGIPADRLTQSDAERFLALEDEISRQVVGHRHVIAAMAQVLRRNYAGFRSQRPIGSLLFLGPTGVGKTELVKALANILFHDRDAIVRLDMSEFMESHAVARLIGAPPGYVGFDAGGQLTEAVRNRPYQIVLLDEIEKAHPDILNVLLQLFDEGRLTDGSGRTVDFSNTVIVMTSNLGAQVFKEPLSHTATGAIGFRSSCSEVTQRVRTRLATSRRVLEAASGHFPPELWARIDEKLVFMPLERDEIAQIARLQLEDSARRLAAEGGITMRFDDEVIDYLIAHGGFDRKLGARPMRQTIQRLVESSVADLILARAVGRGGQIHVRVRDDSLVLEPDTERARETARA